MKTQLLTLLKERAQEAKNYGIPQFVMGLNDAIDFIDRQPDEAIMSGFPKAALEIHGWDMHEMQTKLTKSSLFECLALYKEQENLFSSKCGEYLQASRDKNATAKERLEAECFHLEKEKCVIALHIADLLTKEESE